MGIAFGSLELPEEVVERLSSSTEGDTFMKLSRKSWSSETTKEEDPNTLLKWLQIIPIFD